jgi:hypothetical protein
MIDRLRPPSLARINACTRMPGAFETSILIIGYSALRCAVRLERTVQYVYRPGPGRYAGFHIGFGPVSTHIDSHRRSSVLPILPRCNYPRSSRLVPGPRFEGLRDIHAWGQLHVAQTRKEADTRETRERGDYIRCMGLCTNDLRQPLSSWKGKALCA